MGHDDSPPFDVTVAGQLIRSLKNRGEYIERKFQNARPHDLNPEYAQTILSEATELSNSLPVPKPEIESIKHICASAITLYDEPANRPFFFEHMDRLIDPLKKL